MKIMVWGDAHVYDRYIKSNAEKFFLGLIENQAVDEEINVYFVNYGAFSKSVLSAVKKVEQRTSKKIETVYVNSNLIVPGRRDSDSCEKVFDRTINKYSGTLEENLPFYVRQRAVIRDELKKADHLLCYFYEILSPNEFKKATDCKKATNLATETTTKKLWENIKKGENLNEREQLVLASYAGGAATKAIAEELHVSSSRVLNIRNLAIRRLKHTVVIGEPKKVQN